MSKRRRKRCYCAYCKEYRSSLLSLAIHQKFDHNRDSKYFLEIENSPRSKLFLKPIKKNGMKKIEYEYQFKSSDLGVIPFYAK